MTDPAGAKLRCARTLVGCDLPTFARLLKVSPRTLQRWENNQEPPPEGIWRDIRTIHDRFDATVDQLVNSHDTRVRVWRGETDQSPLPAQMWMMAVAVAMMERPKLLPLYPEDFTT